MAKMFQKKVMKTAIGSGPPASPAALHRGQDMENSLSERCAKIRNPVLKQSNKQFTKKIYSQNFRSYTQVYRGSGCQKKWPLDCATNFL